MITRKKRTFDTAPTTASRKERKLPKREPVPEESKRISSRICRICLSCDDPETPVINLFEQLVQGTKLSEVLSLVGAVEITQEDGLPEFCCAKCLGNVEQAYSLRILCQDSDRQLRNGCFMVELVTVKEEVGEDGLNSVDEKDCSVEDVNCSSMKVKHESSEEDVACNESINSDVDDREQTSEKKAKITLRKSELSEVCDEIPGIGFSCCGCKRPFETLEDLHEHGQEVHAVDKLSAQQSDQKNQCDVCYRVFTEKRSLMKHKHTSGTNFRCKTCSDVFSNRAQVYTHYRRMHGPNATVSDSSRICCGCKEKFESLEKLKAHSNAVHLLDKLPPDPERPFVCNICYRHYTTETRLFAHRIRLIKRIKKHQCVQCGKTFTSPSQLQDHELTHIGAKIFQCPECPQVYTNRESLRKHVQRHRTPEDKFKCKICNRCFKTNYVLKEHLVLHSGERPRQCPYCPANFARESSLTQHVKYLHQKLKPFPCFFCPKRYPRMGYRRKHMEKAHADELRDNPVPVDELFGKRQRGSQVKQESTKRDGSIDEDSIE